MYGGFWDCNTSASIQRFTGDDLTACVSLRIAIGKPLESFLPLVRRESSGTACCAAGFQHFV
jgi:hypothetical protein